ncbi:MAG TPA: glycosyltransferase family 4 protein [Bacteroidota bacterium]
MRILVTCFSPAWGGLELQARDLACHLQERGHEVWLACLPDSPLEREAKEQQVHPLPFDVTGYVHPRLVWRLGKFIARNQLDIIHCHLSRDIATVVPAMKLSMTEVPIVLTRGMGSGISKKDPLHQFTYGNLALVIAVSSVIHRNILETTPMVPERVVTVPCGIDSAYFSPERVTGAGVRREFGYDRETTVVGFVGRFSPGKGHEELLKAAAAIAKQRPRTRFLVVGQASHGEQAYEQQIRKMHAEMGLEGVMTFAGYRKDVPEVMAAFDLLAFPSHAEAFGLVLTEAMAMERAVVASSSDGVLDIVVDGETGLLVPPRDADRLAGGLLRLIDDPPLRERLGKAGRRRVLEFFDQKKQLDRLEELYGQLQRHEPIS